MVPQSTVTSSVAPRPASVRIGLDVGAVAFENPVGDVDDRIDAAMAQKPGQQRRRGRAIDVVVAEDRDPLAPLRRVGDALAAASISVTVCGSGISLRMVGSRKCVDRIDLDTAPGQHSRQQFRHIVALRDRKRPRRPARIEPVAPHLAGRGLRHAQKSGLYFDRQCGCRKRHNVRSR